MPRQATEDFQAFFDISVVAPEGSSFAHGTPSRPTERKMVLNFSKTCVVFPFLVRIFV
jgi:hypothetical protein